MTSQNPKQPEPLAAEQPELIKALVHRWMATANGHTRLGNGYKPGGGCWPMDMELAARALAKAEMLRLCADELEGALSGSVLPLRSETSLRQQEHDNLQTS